MRLKTMLFIIFPFLILCQNFGFGAFKKNEAQEQEIKNYLAGSQLVYYTKTSIFNDSQASSITYVNFCGNGNYQINYDGSFMVSGDGGWAGGGSNGNDYGNWDVILYNNVYYLKMTDGYGNTDYYPIDSYKLSEGRWKQGNTQYALVRNKVVCN